MYIAQEFIACNGWLEKALTMEVIMVNSCQLTLSINLKNYLRKLLLLGSKM